MKKWEKPEINSVGEWIHEQGKARGIERQRGRRRRVGGPISCGTSPPELANIPSAFLFTGQIILFTTSEICFPRKSHLKDPWVFPGGRERARPRAAVHATKPLWYTAGYYPGR